MKKKRKKSALSAADGKKQGIIDTFPLGSMMGGFYMEFTDNKTVVVDGCKGIVKLTEDSIVLYCGKHHVSFSGKKLHIGALTLTGATVTGDILSVGFSFVG